MAILDDLIQQISDEELRNRISKEVGKLTSKKKFGLVYEEHIPECTPLYDVKIKRGANIALKDGKLNDIYSVKSIKDGIVKAVHRVSGEEAEFDENDVVAVAQFGEPIYPYLKPIDTVKNNPDGDLWHTLIEADNYHALQLLAYLYPHKVDCIYIDPPYNKPDAKDWKYNNNYVDGNDAYRHSKWLSMIEKRLKLTKQLLNPEDSVLIITIDEKEYLHLGMLLEDMFPEANMQMISTTINAKGVARGAEFFRVNEYIFVLRFGVNGVTALPLSDDWLGNVRNTTTKRVRWGSLMRSGSGSARKDSPGCFYPIFISDDKKRFCGVGDVIPLGVSRDTVKVPDGQIAIFPIHDDGSEGRWQYSRDNFITLQSKGYARISTQTKQGKEATIRYISEGWQKRVESGDIKVVGQNEDGSLVFDDDEYTQEYIPSNQWWIPSHDATEFGSKLLTKIFGKRFDFPKSLYAVHDTLKFFVANKKNALILDFFAGSGTTLHAVNLLNAIDGGSRRCIMVTNNELSDSESKELRFKGFKPGDEAWDELGIARYVTWPRTIATITGNDIKGKPLKGDYGTYHDEYEPDQEQKGKYVKKSNIPDYPALAELQMKDGFKTNAAFFKLGFLDKNNVSLGRQFREMLPLLWMKAGGHHECPSLKQGTTPNMLIYPKNRFAVLVNEAAYPQFQKEVNSLKEIETVYIVTDSQAGYREMIKGLSVDITYQLYRDYLDNFRINTGR